MPKGSHNGTKNDAKTHQESMPKLVTNKIMKLIENHVSLNGKIIENHCENKCFYGLEGCMGERERYQKNIKSETKIHPKIDEKSIQISCSKKGYPKHKKKIETKEMGSEKK